jgi:hypothetical protein
VDPRSYDKLVKELTSIADILYEIIYIGYKKALVNEGKYHTTFFKNQEDITTLLEEKKKEFDEQEKAASNIFRTILS